MSDNRTVVLVEEDYKGEYARFALTPEEFLLLFQSAPSPSGVGDCYTLRPMAHIWYCSATVGSDDWRYFFTDMADGLSESDVENGNLAYISWNLISRALLDDVIQTVHPRHVAPDVAAEYRGIADELAAEPTSDLEREAAHALWHLLDLLQA